MNTKEIIVYKLITFIALIMTLIQAPLFYYYTFGLFSFFVIIPYLNIGLILTVIILVKVLKEKNQYKSSFLKKGLISIIIIGTILLFLGEQIIEKIDWNLRMKSRKEIVEKVRNGDLYPNANHNNTICTIEDWSFPPISNGGNEISISFGKNKGLTIKFYINRGFLGHYSAFVYTDDHEMINELEERIKTKHGNHINKKLKENWYRVSY